MSDEFRKAMQGVKPLKGDHKPMESAKLKREKIHQKSQAKAHLRKNAESFNQSTEDQTNFTEISIQMVEPNDMLSFNRPSVSPTLMKKLRTGKLATDWILDLHGVRLKDAEKLLIDSIQEAREAGYQTLMVLHGKGEFVKPKALLKSWVNHWLPQIPEVLAFHSAPYNQGGYGALYVLVKVL